MIRFVSILCLFKNILHHFSFSLCLINMQVDKLKILSESLANFASKVEKHISDHKLLALPIFICFCIVVHLFQECVPHLKIVLSSLTYEKKELGGRLLLWSY